MGLLLYCTVIVGHGDQVPFMGLLLYCTVIVGHGDQVPFYGALALLHSYCGTQ